MKVKELIQILVKIDQDKEVFVSRDEEGNGYGTLDKSSVEDNGKSVVLYPYEEYVDENKIF